MLKRHAWTLPIPNPTQLPCSTQMCECGAERWVTGGVGRVRRKSKLGPVRLLSIPIVFYTDAFGIGPLRRAPLCTRT